MENKRNSQQVGQRIKKHKTVKILAILIFLTSLWACGKKSSPFNQRFTLRIEGVVTDGATNSPIAKAIAQLYDFRAGYSDISPHIVAQADTDQNGNYYIEFSEVGTLESVYFYFRMGAAADGYREFNILAQGKGVDCTEELQIINIQLEPI